jgi:hypothetical protein
MLYGGRPAAFSNLIQLEKGFAEWFESFSLAFYPFGKTERRVS